MRVYIKPPIIHLKHNVYIYMCTNILNSFNVYRTRYVCFACLTVGVFSLPSPLLTLCRSRVNQSLTCRSLNSNCFAIMHNVALLGYSFLVKLFLKTVTCFLLIITYFFSTKGHEAILLYTIHSKHTHKVCTTIIHVHVSAYKIILGINDFTKLYIWNLLPSFHATPYFHEFSIFM